MWKALLKEFWYVPVGLVVLLGGYVFYLHYQGLKADLVNANMQLVRVQVTGTIQQKRFADAAKVAEANQREVNKQYEDTIKSTKASNDNLLSQLRNSERKLYIRTNTCSSGANGGTGTEQVPDGESYTELHPETAVRIITIGNTADELAIRHNSLVDSVNVLLESLCNAGHSVVGKCEKE